MRRYVVVSLLGLMSFFIPLPSPVVAQQICFPEQPSISACLDEPFASYWQSNGGLPVFGYPLSSAASQHSIDQNAELLTQWTERARLEDHPENPEPYRVLMGRLGADRLAQLNRDPAQEGREAGARDGCLWFEETGHNVCDQGNGLGFRSYWQTHGLSVAGLDDYNRSLQLFGLPLTEAHMEVNSSGLYVLTQWFERARFEWYPSKPDEYKVQLGLLGREIAGLNASAPTFGMEITAGKVASVSSQISTLGASWVRYNNMVWSSVEPTQGARNWSALPNAEAELPLLSAQGLKTIAVVRSAPAWAQQFADSACGPVKSDSLDAFASFMHDMVARYSQAPYNVHYWEIWNEPDVDPDLVSSDSIFGCWGDDDDAGYGGGYYAEMLKHVYPQIKAADPSAQVIMGGLLLDCDPNNPPAGKDCHPARFLSGVLANGGGDFFDILAYHGYSYWSDTDSDWDLTNGNWSGSGGAILGKLAFLRNVMAQYGVAKPVLLNETGLLCTQNCPHSSYDPDQANYLVRVFTRAQAQGLVSAIWYTLNGPGWRGNSLLDESQQPRQSYQAMHFLSAYLGTAGYAGTLSTGALEGYRFFKGTKMYSIYWTNDGSTVKLALSATPTAVYNKLGQTVTIGSEGLVASHEPVIIETDVPYSTFVNLIQQR